MTGLRERLVEPAHGHVVRDDVASRCDVRRRLELSVEVDANGLITSSHTSEWAELDAHIEWAFR